MRDIVTPFLGNFQERAQEVDGLKNIFPVVMAQNLGFWREGAMFTEGAFFNGQWVAAP